MSSTRQSKTTWTETGATLLPSGQLLLFYVVAILHSWLLINKFERGLFELFVYYKHNNIIIL